MPGVSPPLSLHSRYDPAKEARRYVESRPVSFSPAIIFVSEPGESWLAPVFRERYPQAKLVALRYQDGLFRDTDGLWDAVWRPGSGSELSRFLFDIVPDEYLPLTVFLPWKPSDLAWPDAARSVWEAVASMLRLQQGIMHTRSHFGRRWLSNMIKNAAGVRSAMFPVHTEKPVFLACAGPSLARQLPLSGETFYVCAVSSALSCLKEANCTPDLCMATDGGYWALDHFRTIDAAIPVAFPLEAAIPPAVLESNTAVLLTYGSALENTLFALAGIVPVPAERNGTVSGTAARYALSHTDGSVYAAGLDLCGSTSFSHARPHASDASLAFSADRLHPLCGRLFAQNLDTASLDLYASWFSSRDAEFRSRFFRLLPEGKPLEGIRAVPIASVPVVAGLQTGKTVLQQIPDSMEREERIRFWLGKLADALAPYTDAASFAAPGSGFQADVLADPVLNEVLQLVSYTGYIRMLKKRNEACGAEFAEAARELCGQTAAFLEKLRSALASGGQS